MASISAAIAAFMPRRSWASSRPRIGHRRGEVRALALKLRHDRRLGEDRVAEARNEQELHRRGAPRLGTRG